MSQGDWMGAATLLALIAFIGVCVWAFSDRRKAQFDEAAQLPFADEPPRATDRGDSDE